MSTKALAKLIVFVEKHEIPLLLTLGMSIAALPLILDGLLISGLFYTFAVGIVSMAMLINHKKFIKLNDELSSTLSREQDYKKLAEAEAALAKKERENFLNAHSKAELWEALLDCKRVVFVGGIDANLPTGYKIKTAEAVNHDYTHIAVEFWMTDHPTLAPLDTKLPKDAGRIILTKFAKQCRTRRQKR